MKLRTTCLGLTLIALVATSGCKKTQATPAAPPAPKPAEVLINLPVTGEITDYEDFSGRTVAVKTIELRARVTGYLDKIHFTEGEEVKQGDLLFEIDPRPYLSALERAKSSVTAAEARLKRLDSDLQRASNLMKTNAKAISREEYDRAVGDRAEGDAALGVAEADLRLATLNLNYTKVKAPISGRPSRTQLDPGNLVRVDQTVLTTIVSQDPIYAYFDVDERTLLKMRRLTQQGKADKGDLPVMMGLADEQGYPHEGRINFVDNQLDASSGTLQTRGVFENQNRLLSPGFFVRVRLPIGEAYRAILIDEQALATDQGQKYLYVVDKDNKVEYRRVEVGKLQQKKRVILEGLAEGERVVVSGLQRIRPGVVVEPKMIEATAGSEGQETGGVAQAELGGKRRP